MGYTWECSGQSHLSHIVEWDIVLVTHMGGGGGGVQLDDLTHPT